MALSFCESGNQNNGHSATLFTDDPLWDGQQCEGTCCTGTNSPPWFSGVSPDNERKKEQFL